MNIDGSVDPYTAFVLEYPLAPLRRGFVPMTANADMYGFLYCMRVSTMCYYHVHNTKMQGVFSGENPCLRWTFCGMK
ncbi:MAG: hypothetical protein A2Y65_01685 [Deltaproteobacteria bacterium RBG_13_52_11]|nr:MAG: hypothetical protein A2Y65_01685 [Deltaproteobacteria bacterium RBG_13_52_11]